MDDTTTIKSMLHIILYGGASASIFITIIVSLVGYIHRSDIKHVHDVFKVKTDKIEEKLDEHEKDVENLYANIGVVKKDYIRTDTHELLCETRRGRHG